MGTLLFIVYLIEKVDVFVSVLKNLGILSAILLGVIAIVSFLLWGNGEDKILKKFGPKLKMWSRIALATTIVSFSVAVLMPTKNFIYIAVGVKAGQEIIQHKNINTLMDKSLKALELKLDDVIKELDANDVKESVKESVKGKANDTINEIKGDIKNKADETLDGIKGEIAQKLQ